MISSCSLYTYFLLLLISPLTLSITDDGQDKQFEDDIAKQEIESEIANEVGDVAILAENTSSLIAFDNAADLLSQLGKPEKRTQSTCSYGKNYNVNVLTKYLQAL